jgi:hypothetical protein
MSQAGIFSDKLLAVRSKLAAAWPLDATAVPAERARNAMITHTRQLTASQSCCFPGFFIHRPPICSGRFDSLTFNQERDG